MPVFDPYHRWLGIPPDEQPAGPQRLLGVSPDENDPQVVREAALRQTAFVRKFSMGEHGEHAERILGELADAKDKILSGKVESQTKPTVKPTPSPMETIATPLVIPTPAVDRETSKADPTPRVDPLKLKTSERTAISSKPLNRSGSRSGKPVWQQPWATAVGGAIAMLLIMMLFGSGEETKEPANTADSQAQQQINELKQKLAAAERSVSRQDDSLVKENEELGIQIKELTHQNADLKEELGVMAADSTAQLSAAISAEGKQPLKFAYTQHNAYDGKSGITLNPNSSVDLGESWVLRCRLSTLGTVEKLRPFIVWGDNRPGLDALSINYGGGKLTFGLTDCIKRRGKGGELPIFLKAGKAIDIELNYSSSKNIAVLRADGREVTINLDFKPTLDRASPLYIGVINGYPGKFNGKVTNFIFGNSEANTSGEEQETLRKLIPKDAVAFGGHHYLLVDRGATWTSAMLESEQRGGYLVKIDSVEEHDFLISLLKENPPKNENGHVWINGSRLFDGENYIFSDNRPVDFNSMRTAPFTSSGSDLFLAMFEPDNWHVQDVVFHPNGLHAFIIEWEEDENPSGSSKSAIAISFREGLVAYYPFNGNSNDESGNGHHGKVNGATLALDRFGRSQEAYQFDGNTAYISVSHHKDLDFAESDEVTVSLWIRPTRFQKSNGILSKYQSNGSNGYLLRLIDESGGLEWGPNARRSSYGISADNALQLLKWQHVVLVHDKGSSDLYLDAEMLARGPNRWSKNEDDLTIGRDYTEGTELNRLFAGSIDDVRIYNRALSVEEVKALYEFEKP